MLDTSILSYQGPLSFSTIDWLLSEFKMVAQDHDISFKAYKKMVSVLIETLENISKYSVQVHCNGEPLSGFCPSLRISRSESEIEMETRNPVNKRDEQTIRSRIDKINEQNSEELKELYKSTMTDGLFSSSGGAGLGFIEIAKTTGSKLEYNFESLSKEYSIYTFRVSMNI
jgi:D-mannonate dehydratase